MSANYDEDSQMLSSPDDSDNTPIQSTILSPPESQNRAAMHSPAGANANGKRPINTISNGADDAEELETMQANGKARQEFPTRTHERSGYSWNREEDAPGYAWLNKKALDEYHRAAEVLVHKDHVVKGRYGDPFEMVEQEKAMLNSLKQQ